MLGRQLDVEACPFVGVALGFPYPKHLSMFDLARFTVAETYACSAALRQLGAPTQEGSADRVARYLFEHLRDSRTGGPSCPLVRIFTSMPASRLDPRLLPPEAAEAVREKRAIKCLVLSASRGILPEWCDPALSVSHRVIPLLSEEALTRLPMIRALLSNLEVPAGVLFGPSIVLPRESRWCGVFHVEQAAGSPHVPDQRFVERHGIRSVVGFGGILPSKETSPSKEMFATILFSTVPIPVATAELFRVIALSVGLALLPGSREVASLEHRCGVLEELLRRHEEIALARQRLLETRAEELSRSARVARLTAEAREQQMGVAAHELRGPATTIRLVAEAMTRTAPIIPQPQRRRLETVARQARQLSCLVDSLLDVARMDRGDLAADLRRALVDLGALVREAVADVDEEAKRSGMLVQVTTEPEVVGSWDRGRILQVVGNLLSNAIKHGGGPIEVQVARVPGFASLSVQDHGPGIAPDLVERVFQPFERPGAPRNSSGLGLGLYVSRGIVEAHGGSLSVEGGSGEGARFTVRLPLA